MDTNQPASTGSLSEIGRRLQAARKRELRTCEGCQREFWALTTRQTCSPTCRERRYRRRKRALRAAQDAQQLGQEEQA